MQTVLANTNTLTHDFLTHGFWYDYNIKKEILLFFSKSIIVKSDSKEIDNLCFLYKDLSTKAVIGNLCLNIDEYIWQVKEESIGFFFPNQFFEVANELLLFNDPLDLIAFKQVYKNKYTFPVYICLSPNFSFDSFQVLKEYFQGHKIILCYSKTQAGSLLDIKSYLHFRSLQDRFLFLGGHNEFIVLDKKNTTKIKYKKEIVTLSLFLKDFGLKHTGISTMKPKGNFNNFKQVLWRKRL